MSRAKGGPKTRARRKRWRKRAQGYSGWRKNLYAVARAAVDRALAFAFTGRKQRKRQFRRLWISRINAAARICGTTYSRLINGLGKANIELDRKILADLAVNDMDAFSSIAKMANEST